ncbi:MAG: nucleotidyl transferase AbiEii/AbiGii toxin family protein [Candidatus Anstonellales archaeon]
MDEVFLRRYKKVMEILPDVAECLHERAILIGGTALALFYLKHRISIDLDFVAADGESKIIKEELKGCLSKKGYRTIRGAYKDQFVVQFEDTGIKVEFFEPDEKIKSFSYYAFGNSRLLVASIEEILKLKMGSYAQRKEARDLFDIFFILKKEGKEINRIIKKFGPPKNMEELRILTDEKRYQEFAKVVKNASKTSSKL